MSDIAPSKGIYIYEAEPGRWHWQVIVGNAARSSDEKSFAAARLRAENALAALEARA